MSPRRGMTELRPDRNVCATGWVESNRKGGDAIRPRGCAGSGWFHRVNMSRRFQDGIVFGQRTGAQAAAAAVAVAVLKLPFAVQYFDSESNLNYNYFKSYQPGQDRYMQGDPIGLDGASIPLPMGWGIGWFMPIRWVCCLKSASVLLTLAGFLAEVADISQIIAASGPTPRKLAWEQIVLCLGKAALTARRLALMQKITQTNELRPVPVAHRFPMLMSNASTKLSRAGNVWGAGHYPNSAKASCNLRLAVAP